MDPLEWVCKQGVVLQSARGPVPNLAEHVAGEPLRGSWWGHSSGHEIFAVLTRVLDSPDVIATRVVDGKVTLIHRRVWPALVRVADRFPAERLASVDEVHTASGAHRTIETPLPRVDPRRRPRRRRAAHYRRGARAAARLPSLMIDSFVTAAGKSPVLPLCCGGPPVRRTVCRRRRPHRLNRRDIAERFARRTHTLTGGAAFDTAEPARAHPA